MKKWLLILTVLLVVGLAGYKFVMSFAADKMIDGIENSMLAKEDIEKLKMNPEIEKQMEAIQNNSLPSLAENQNGAAEDNQNLQNNNSAAGQTPGKGNLMFADKDEALKFVLTKFTMGELTSLAQKAQGGLTGQEKAEIKSVLMQRLTPGEFQALKAMALKELAKRKM
ncbi:hypothetical protein Dtox_3983 [Desulfofarcimen acetoxidans DSM 771]|jgi:hypothetical protein|uniref:Uncharacterized protein n=1 Tax=Desulfofarcimen acetoxidans (strain ATCC 49208 / DSM 771 / KCTC 5769 / VKM B-1644 / 5575) TaxID=485916 RepID=C8VY47_DESAS|nr:hypothetical protein [Desulfofarcimen acetoxidans]ACV64676.1 hypothetical protein Dtox_3983 [Desulfofarcimen acetoxidans DSM 771]